MREGTLSSTVIWFDWIMMFFFRIVPFLRSLSFLFEITPPHCLFICIVFFTPHLPSPSLPHGRDNLSVSLINTSYHKYKCWNKSTGKQIRMHVYILYLSQISFRIGWFVIQCYQHHYHKLPAVTLSSTHTTKSLKSSSKFKSYSLKRRLVLLLVLLDFILKRCQSTKMLTSCYTRGSTRPTATGQ